MKLIDVINNLFFVRRCLFCGKILPLSVNTDYCLECEANAAFKRDRLCTVCGRPLRIPRGEPLCNLCKRKKMSFVQNVTRYLYLGDVRKSVIDMKFHKNNQWIAYALGGLLAETVKSEYADIKFDGVAFVPISRKREKKRGYNQSELIAEAVAERMRLPVLRNALVKIKDNEKQSTLKMSQRASNVKGAYTQGKTDVFDMTILLIDDVYTTGATINECAKVLKKCGAALVYCATVCAAERSGRFCFSENTLKKLKKC